MKFNIIALENELDVASSLDNANYPRNLISLVQSDKNMPQCDAVVFLRAKIDKNLFNALEVAFSASPSISAFALRTLPRDFCGYIDLPSLKIFCLEENFAIKSSILQEIGGVDDKMSLCVAKDLSRRILSIGTEMMYLPNALVFANAKVKDLSNYVNENIANLLFSCKFSRFSDIMRETSKYINVLKQPVHFDGVRKALLKKYFKAIPSFCSAFFGRIKNYGTYKKAKAVNTGFQICRNESFLTKPIENAPKISVLIRTHDRPESLRETLKSLRYSTYKNYEIVIVEDGKAVSEEMVKKEFADLPISYTSTQVNVGRSNAGNLAVSLAKGEYCNFLDDDDFFYPDHLEMMAAIAAKHSDAQLILGCADVLYADKKSSPYSLLKRKIMPLFFDKINAFTLCQRGQIPIQSACFKKELFTLYGGLDERLNCNEDWAMWLKYIAQARRANIDTPDINRSGSVFVLPASQSDASLREGAFAGDENILFNDENIRFNVSISDMRKFYNGVLQDVNHLYNQNLLSKFLKQKNLESEKETLTDDKHL